MTKTITLTLTFIFHPSSLTFNLKTLYLKRRFLRFLHFCKDGLKDCQKMCIGRRKPACRMAVCSF